MTTSVTNGRRVTSVENSEYGISPVDDRMPAPKTFVSPRFLDQAELDAEPTEPLQREHLVAVAVVADAALPMSVSSSA